MDRTVWGAWQIGQADITFDLEDKDAVWFKLTWL